MPTALFTAYLRKEPSRCHDFPAASGACAATQSSPSSERQGSEEGRETIRGDIPVASTWTGPSEIIDGFLARLTATLDQQTPVTQDLHRIIADGDYAVAEWTSHARARARNGASYDNDCAVVFHVTGGHIDAVTEYCDTSYMKRVLFDQ